MAPRTSATKASSAPMDTTEAAVSAVSAATRCAWSTRLVVLRLHLRDLLLRLIERDAAGGCKRLGRLSARFLGVGLVTGHQRRMAFVAAAFSASGSVPVARTWFSMASRGLL